MWYSRGRTHDHFFGFDHDRLDYCTFGLQAVNDAQFVRADRACGKDHDQQNLSKTITWYPTIYNEITSDQWWSLETCVSFRYVSRVETHIYTSLSWLSVDAFMSCLGSSLVAPCLVLALSHDCLWCLSSMRTSLMIYTVWVLQFCEVCCHFLMMKPGQCT